MKERGCSPWLPPQRSGKDVPEVEMILFPVNQWEDAQFLAQGHREEGDSVPKDHTVYPLVPKPDTQGYIEIRNLQNRGLLSHRALFE